MIDLVAKDLANFKVYNIYSRSLNVFAILLISHKACKDGND